MNKNLQRILERCHRLMDNGRDLDYCLKRFSRYKKGIRDYFSLVEELGQLRKAGPPRQFRDNSLDKIISRAENQKTSIANRSHAPVLIRRKLVLKPVFVFIILILLSLFTFGGTLFASQDSLPGETLYPLKRSFEEFKISIYPEDLKGGLHFRLLNNRIGEAQVLLDMDNSTDPRLIEELISEIDRQFSACRQYRYMDQGTEKKVLGSIDSVKSMYRSRFGKDPNNDAGLQDGQGKQDKEDSRENGGQGNNSKGNARGKS